MTKTPSIKALQLENQHLRDLIISLNAKLLRNAATQLCKTDHPDTRRDAERLVDEAEQCFKCARIAGLKEKVAEGLEAAGHELLARAVLVDTKLERARTKQLTTRSTSASANRRLSRRDRPPNGLNRRRSRGAHMEHDIIRENIERYEKLLEAARDAAERRFILKLLEQERARLDEACRKDGKTK